tara:strand:+ start:2861 stop:3199 length:339 start_codon:yes stop_codon:yes gene_type:complete
VSDAFRLEVFVDKDGTVHDEVLLDKVGDDTSKWDYLLDYKIHHINNLPSWMRRKLAVLKMRSYDPPTEDIPEIGQRISKYIFWIYPNEGHTDGDDTGEKSKAGSSEAIEEYG